VQRYKNKLFGQEVFLSKKIFFINAPGERIMPDLKKGGG
jgi:hypothetical protein